MTARATLRDASFRRPKSLIQGCQLHYTFDSKPTAYWPTNGALSHAFARRA